MLGLMMGQRAPTGRDIGKPTRNLDEPRYHGGMDLRKTTISMADSCEKRSLTFMTTRRSFYEVLAYW